MSTEQTIDLRIGEVRTIRDITRKLFDLDNIPLNMSPMEWEYHPRGYKPLVDFLEDKYAAPVLITNGANQALHAAMYALKMRGCNNMGIRIPYWNRIPEIAKHIGIGFSPFEGTFFSENSEKNLKIDSYLLTAPNNPDGFLPPLDILRMCSSLLKEQNVPLIHDAVYYTRSYIPIDYPRETIGDVQIFSASKTYGLSSLRVGYMVIYNASFYRLLADYMEFSTVGASIPAQKIFLYILQREKQLPFLKENFDKFSKEEIKKAKLIFKNVNPCYLELPDNFERISGVFAWVKLKMPDLFKKINVEVLPGDIFGMPGYCRINLAAGNDIINEVIGRINNV